MKLSRLSNLIVLVLFAAVAAVALVVAHHNWSGPNPAGDPTVLSGEADSVRNLEPVPAANPGAVALPTHDAWDRSPDYPMSRRGDFIYLLTNWSGKPGQFVVDTGAAMNVVDATVFPDLPNPVRRQVQRWVRPGESTVTDEAVCDPPSMKVGPFELERGGQVVRLDLSATFKEEQPPVIGVLGLPSISRRALQLDFEHLCFRFLHPAAGHGDWGTAVPLSLIHEQQLAANVRSGPHAWQSVIDTGCNYDGCIQSTRFDQFTDAPLVQLGVAPATDRARRLRSLNLGDGTMEFHDAMLRDAGFGNDLIGIRLLSQASMVTIDPVNHLMYIKK